MTRALKGLAGLKTKTIWDLIEFKINYDLVYCLHKPNCLTFGREALEPELCVVMVSTVVIPSPTLAGAASMLIQNDTQDRMTVSRLGMYIWIR